jgi:putative ABC transport system permease protein
VLERLGQHRDQASSVAAGASSGGAPGAAAAGRAGARRGAGVGGAAGAAAGMWAVKLARFIYPNGVPAYVEFRFDGRAFLCAGIVTALTAVLAGIVPALRTSHVDVTRTLRDGERSGMSASSRRIRDLLVIGELALSSVLLIGGVLLLRSYEAYARTDLGFERDGILTARITLPERRYDASALRIGLFATLEADIRAIPGVTHVGSAQGIPFSGWNLEGSIAFLDRRTAGANDDFVAHFQSVFPDFFPALGIPVVRGRALLASDHDTLAPVAVVNETFARKAFPNEDAIGKHVKYGGANDPQPWMTIVGVVRDFRHYQLPQAMPPALYTTYAVTPSRSHTLVIRTTLPNPYSIVPAIRARLRALDPQLALYDVKTMADAVDQSFWRQRLQSQVLGVFAVLALVLATVGVYGVISYNVAQRTREIGVRTALGAPRRAVIGLVLSDGLRLLGVALVVGLGSALLLTPAIRSLLYGVEATDTATFLIVGVTLTVLTVAASYVPAARAARVDPLLAMRAE